MGALRRRIRIVAGSGEVRGTLEDDFHHFRVALRHDGKFIVDTACEPIRYPFSLCPAAGEQLQVLVGQPLDASVLTLTNYTDRLQQCTHQLDLACLTAATAFQEKSWKTYDIWVDDPEDGDPRPAVLWMNGKKVLDWQFSTDRIISDDEFSGVDRSATNE
mgnify:FL=1